MTTGSIDTYNGNGKYLAPQAVEALPKAAVTSTVPGVNFFGDGFFFGEQMLKEVMVEVIILPITPPPFGPALNSTCLQIGR